MVSIMSRSGEHAHVSRADDPHHPLNDIDEPPPTGEQVDLLRRAMDLPTDPPPCGTGTYWAIEWLAAIVDASCAPDRRSDLDWPEVARLHPAAALLDAGGIDHTIHDFTEMVASFARVCDWARIRALVDKGSYGAVGLRPGDGAWFDDGSIARYLLARSSPLYELRCDAWMAVSDDACDRLEDVLAQLDIPNRVWPDVDASAA